MEPPFFLGRNDHPAEISRRAISLDFRMGLGSLAGLMQTFVAEGAGHFGSGWVWLVADTSARLRVRSTHDADDTLIHG